MRIGRTRLVLWIWVAGCLALGAPSRAADSADGGGGLFGAGGGDLDLKSLNLSIQGSKGKNDKAVLATKDFFLDYNTFEFNKDTKTLTATGDKKRPLTIEMRGQGFKANCDRLTYSASTGHYVLSGNASISQASGENSMIMAGETITIDQPSEGELRVEIQSKPGGHRARLSNHSSGGSDKSKSKSASAKPDAKSSDTAAPRLASARPLSAPIVSN